MYFVDVCFINAQTQVEMDHPSFCATLHAQVSIIACNIDKKKRVMLLEFRPLIIFIVHLLQFEKFSNTLI